MGGELWLAVDPVAFVFPSRGLLEVSALSMKALSLDCCSWRNRFCLNNVSVVNLLLTFVLDCCSCCRRIHIPGRRKPFRSRRRSPEAKTKEERC